LEHKHARKEGNQRTCHIDSEGKPSVRGPQVDKGPILSIDSKLIISHEPSLIIVCSNGDDTTQGFSEWLEERASVDGLKTL
jgi:hypothetical protein